LSELGFFLGDLKAQLAFNKPAERVAFAQKYFENVRSGAHVVGMPYGYILESNYNRRALVARLMDSFSGFADGTDISSSDFFSLVESVSPGFPKSIVLEVSQCLKPDQETDGSETVHVFKYLSSGVYCCVLYDEWLKLIADYYADESSVNSMNALKLKSKLEDFHCGLSPSINQPPLSVIYNVLESATPSSSGTGTSSYLVEITLDHFRRTLFLSEAVRNEIQRLRN
jgi:hypothetical protein